MRRTGVFEIMRLWQVVLRIPRILRNSYSKTQKNNMFYHKLVEVSGAEKHLGQQVECVQWLAWLTPAWSTACWL